MSSDSIRHVSRTQFQGVDVVKMGDKIMTPHGLAVLVLAGYDEKNRLVELVLELVE